MCEAVIDRPVMLKICKKCGVAKTVSEFSKATKARDGLQSWCKTCLSKANKKSREKNRARETIVIPEFKTCPGCKGEKPSSDFNKHDRNKDGLQSFCKKCCSKKNKTSREKNKAREVIVIPELKFCHNCKTEKSSSDFNKHSRNRDGLVDYCKECLAILKRKRKYGLSPEQFNAMLESQGGSCYICKFIPGPEDEELDVDHIHGTNIIRGLLHRKCNRGLGFFKDDIVVIGKAIEYLTGPTIGIVYKKNLDKAIKTKILRAQGYLCKICSVDLHNKRVHFDHDHLTNMIRGALCHGCNCGMGQFDDSVVLLQKTILYLKKFEGDNLVSITKSSKEKPLFFGEII